MTVQEKFMQRCLQLAGQAIGKVAPNPMVGAVIVHEGKIIGEGFHQQFGGAHAEVNAIKSVVDKTLLAHSTLYVNLEPCSHFGKTPPCVDLIIAHKIPEVVIGIQDPFAEVNGAGIKKLEDAQVKVTVGILENECKQLNKRFITFYTKSRPYIILKWAQTADGFIGKKTGPVKISNDVAKILTHRWRSEEQSILIGSGTAIIDNPQLTVREWSGPSPIRIIIDRKGKLPKGLQVFDGTQRTIVISSDSSNEVMNAEKIIIENNDDFLQNALSSLQKHGIQSILVEGGATLLQTFIDQELWDEARVFTAPLPITETDDALKVKAPLLSLPSYATEMIGDNFLHLYQSFSAIV
jgi:diaminohydroxyphosphoribosylaminopyrimidine deaminase/5-amino-6-(5-phosphoribosylamino)uracil reductase